MPHGTEIAVSWTLEPDPGDAGVGTEHGATAATPRSFLRLARILVVRRRHLHPPDTGLGANVGVTRTTSKLLVLVELLNLTFDLAPHVRRDSNVRFAPLAFSLGIPPCALQDSVQPSPAACRAAPAREGWPACASPSLRCGSRQRSSSPGRRWYRSPDRRPISCRRPLTLPPSSCASRRSS
ncbi:hypothetical protein CHELA40_14578 [Chelatococcus asaccharovorans]|nr:hypothetical protein CHELA17_61041 [Chelatococcus asaccharovorans]CAH1678513.1 hypothetical protein CHELA40_14578 [Chelatococcus asaccharovorans]